MMEALVVPSTFSCGIPRYIWQKEVQKLVQYLDAQGIVMLPVHLFQPLLYVQIFFNNSPFVTNSYYVDDIGIVEW
jgi:hypothetical protein